MYYDFFGFREPPFSIAPDPRYLYLSERHKEALAHLMYGVQGQGGFVVVTGEVGTGKTTVSRCFIENVPDHVDIALILNPRLSARELLASICDELGIRYPDNAPIKPLIDRINRHLLDAHARGRHQVLIIDEAQNLSAEVLEQLRLLTNLETAEKKLLQIVLLGQPELKTILDRPELRQLNQRVTARYHLDALERGELPAYLHYRLGVAGVKVELFSGPAIRMLYRKSQGVPRLINLISDRALLGAYSEGLQQIEPRHVRAAAREVGGLPRARSDASAVPPMLKLATVAAGIAAIAVAAFAFTEYRSEVDSAGVDALAVVEEAPTEDSAAGVEDGVAKAGDSAGAIVADALAGTGSDQSIAAADSADNNLASGSIDRAGPAVNGGQADDLAVFSMEDFGLTTAEAYQALFERWGYSWDRAAHPFACDYAEQAGLRCLHRQGSRRSMENINRPAVLELRGPSGDTSYVALLVLEQDVATLGTPEGQVQVSFDDLEEYWFGNFSVLWQQPPYMAWDGEPGDLPRENQEGVWLSARMMQLVGLHTNDNREIERVSRMIREEQVRWYQQIKGLEQDGIVGAMTLIQMSNDLDAGVPRLFPDNNTAVAPAVSEQTLQPRSG